jgi:hypothetical protein
MNTSNLAVVGPSEPVPAPTIHILINRAMSEGNIDVAERLLSMAARRAFNKAVAAAKAKIPVIIKTADGHHGKYADFASIARVVDPVIGELGLGYRFRTTQIDAKIAVTCVLFHDEGHSEENTLCGPADSTTNKNPLQAIGSTLTYLQRYTLVQALGLAASKDDDGNGAGNFPGDVEYDPPPGSITAEQVIYLRSALKQSGATERAFLQWAKQKRIEDIPAEHYQSCMDGIASFRKAGK